MSTATPQCRVRNTLVESVTKIDVAAENNVETKASKLHVQTKAHGLESEEYNIQQYKQRQVQQHVEGHNSRKLKVVYEGQGHTSKSRS